MLSDAEIRRIKPGEKDRKLADGSGLYLLVRANGARLWRMKYRFAGKEKLLSFGAYPEVSLAAARAARDSARAELRADQDPSLTKLQRRAAASNRDSAFEPVARAWLKEHQQNWTERHASDVLDSLERLVFPRLGRVPIETITAPMVLEVIRAIEARRAKETARRVRQRMSAIFGFAIGSGLAEGDPAAVVRGALAPLKKGRQPAIVSLVDLRTMMHAAEAVPAHPVTKLAFRFLALTAVRPGELRAMTWRELAGDDWRIPAERMKMRREHVVPLSRQALEALEVVRELTGMGPLPFPNARWARRPMSENAIGYLLNRAGFAGRHVPHGFRAAFSSIMNERWPADRAVIDLMLAHAPKDKVEGAYNRAQHMERRREIAQSWADILLEGAAPLRDLLSGPRRQGAHPSRR